MLETTTNGGSEPDAEELLSHQQHVVVEQLALFVEPRERSVRAPEIGEKSAVVLPADAAVKTRNVAVFGKENVAALAADVDAVLRNRIGIARGIAAGQKRDATDVPFGWASEPLDAVGPRS